MTPLVYCVTGKKGSGKSQVLERVIAGLKSRGRRIGVIKRLARPDLEIDEPGKDTFRYRMNGADTVILSGPKRFAAFSNVDAEVSVTDILASFASFEVVFLEGYPLRDYPAIEVTAGEEPGAAAAGFIALIEEEIECRKNIL
jgi:molybdopterin-guanine dinucleotide biosynthesis protein B